MNAEQQKIQFLDMVKAKIHNKSVEKSIEKELLNHIEEQLESLMTSGVGKEEAMKIILDELGDPKQLGISFRRVHTPKYLLEVALFAITTIGLYTGSLAGYLDLVALFLVIVGAMLLFFIFLCKPNRWSNQMVSLSYAFVYSGVIFAVLSLVSAFIAGNWKKELINVIVLPFWYGLLFCVLITVGKAIVEWRGALWEK